MISAIAGNTRFWSKKFCRWRPARYPVCLDGKRACPPEDCGGIWGYTDLLQTIQNPDSEEYEEMLEWLGGEFDPEAFDLEAINEALKGIK